MTNALPQDVVDKAVPHLQAMQPLVQNAINPSPKGEKSNKSRDDQERSPHRDQRQNQNADAKDKDKDDGHTVNIRV